MEYIELARPLRSDPNGKSFLHAVKMYLKVGRYPELEEFLNNSAGPKHEAWRIQARFLSDEKASSSWMAKRVEPAVVRFTTKAQAILFKLSWDEDVDPYANDGIASLNKVILPVIRRVAPTILANSIIGVQPMTGPVAQIHTMNVKYRGVGYHPPTPEEQERLDQEAAQRELERKALEERKQEMDDSIRDFEDATGMAILPETVARQNSNLDMKAKMDEWTDGLVGKDEAKKTMMAQLLENTYMELANQTSNNATLTTINPAIPPATSSSATTSPSAKTSTDESGNEKK